MIMRVVACVVTLVFGVQAALACGGRFDPEILAPLAPVEQLISPLVTDDDLTGRAETFRFLYAFKDAKRDWSEQMWTLADKGWEGVGQGSADDVKVQPAVDTTPLTTAIKANDWKKAHNEANAVVTAIFQRPSPFAGPENPRLIQAVEYLEVEPDIVKAKGDTGAILLGTAQPSSDAPDFLRKMAAVRSSGATDPDSLLASDPKQDRAPTLELVSLRLQLGKVIGWPGQTTGPSPKKIAADTDAWIKKHPQHPLAPFAVVQKLRAVYLAADYEAAWKIVLDLYATAPARATWEMRHLLLNGAVPSVDLATLKDPVLASALIVSMPDMSESTWNTLWKSAAQTMNMQERLLYAATRMKALPAAFPKTAPTKPSQLWLTLQRAVLVGTGHIDDALALPPPATSDEALIVAKAYMQKNNWAKAASVPKLDSATSDYLVSVIIADSDLEKLGTPAAKQALIHRALAADDWARAASLAATYNMSPDSYKAGADLRAKTDADGQRAFATWLEKNGKEVFDARDTGLSRSYKYRYGDLASGKAKPLVPEETARLRKEILHGGIREQTLEALGRALAGDGKCTATCKSDVKRANVVYNKLLSWDTAENDTYKALLSSSDAAKAIRAAGKR